MANRMTTKIKICGITNLEDSVMCVDLGIDALGFIFTRSERKIEPDKAREIINKLPPFVTTVGIFMDQELARVNEIADYTGIDVIQLHGNEPPEYCQRVNRKIIKRITITKDDTPRWLISKAEKYSVSAYLLDPGAGSGKVFDWNCALGIDLPLIIAGGLTPENVGAAVKLLKPYGVDAVSGVEKSAGLKDRDKVKKFITEVRSCS